MERESAVIELDFLPPFDWGFFLRYWGGRLTAGVETIDGDRYRRAVEIDGDVGLVTVIPHSVAPKLVATVDGAAARHPQVVRERLRRMFDLDRDPATVQAALGADPWIGPSLAIRPRVRVPGAWCPFELLIRTIVGQQVTVRAATTIMGRIASRLGRAVPGAGEPGWLFPSPATLAEGDLEGIGMPAKRVAALRAVARAFAEDSIPMHDPPAARAALLALPGVGPWTVEYFALRGLRDADAWPGSDLVLKRAVERCGAAATERWRPFRGYAAMHLWQSATAGKPP